MPQSSMVSLWLVWLALSWFSLASITNLYQQSLHCIVHYILSVSFHYLFVFLSVWYMASLSLLD